MSCRETLPDSVTDTLSDDRVRRRDAVIVVVGGGDGDRVADSLADVRDTAADWVRDSIELWVADSDDRVT